MKLSFVKAFGILALLTARCQHSSQIGKQTTADVNAHTTQEANRVMEATKPSNADASSSTDRYLRGKALIELSKQKKKDEQRGEREKVRLQTPHR